MVDSNQSDKRGTRPLEEVDPLAELSDIMNFDKPGGGSGHGSDFSSVELENELLGELAAVADEAVRSQGEQRPIADAPELPDPQGEPEAEEAPIDLDKQLQQLLQGLEFSHEDEVSAPDEPVSGQAADLPLPSEGAEDQEAEPRFDRTVPAWPAAEDDLDPPLLETSADLENSSGDEEQSVPFETIHPARGEPDRSFEQDVAYGAPENVEAIAESGHREFDAPVPEMDIIDMPDDLRVLEDDLDIPEITVETPPSTRPDFYELDAEFESAFSKLGEFEKTLREESPAPSRPEQVVTPSRIAATVAAAVPAALRPVEPASSRHHVSEGEFEPVAAREREADPAGYHGFGHEQRADALPEHEDSVASGFEAYPQFPEDEASGPYGESAADDPAADPNGYDPSASAELESWEIEPEQGVYEFDDLTQDDGLAAHTSGTEERSGNRRLLVAGVVAAIAIAGGIGAYALTYGGGDDSGEPGLVRADQDPIKVKPAEPGGVVAPNEDKAVYERVAGGGERLPSQERLISAEEEPVDLSAEATTPRVVLPASGEVAANTTPANTAPVNTTPKSEERLAPDQSEEAGTTTEEFVAVEPRRVRTLVVRPDGTLVPREPPVATAPAPAAESASAAVTAPPATADDVAEENDAIASTLQETGPAAASESPVESEVPATPAVAAPAAPPAAPPAATAPAAPAEPAAREGATREVAAAPAAATTTSEWWVQISSQPSRELAQTSYADLAGRHGSIIGGRAVNIYPAQIEGRGTFYRVRIAASDRNEANDLCNRLKGAGASCFVSR